MDDTVIAIAFAVLFAAAVLVYRARARIAEAPSNEPVDAEPVSVAAEPAPTPAVAYAAAPAYATQAQLDTLVAQVATFFGGQRKTDYEQKITDVLQDVLTDMNAWCVARSARSMIPRFEYKTRGKGRNRLRWEQTDERAMFFDVVDRLRALLASNDAVKLVAHDELAFAEPTRDLVIVVEFRR